MLLCTARFQINHHNYMCAPIQVATVCFESSKYNTSLCKTDICPLTRGIWGNCLLSFLCLNASLGTNELYVVSVNSLFYLLP